jgi:NTE family protein
LSALSRRVALVGGAATAAGFGLLPGLSTPAHPAEGPTPSQPPAAPAKASGAGARVIPYPAPEPFGTGKERALALGGGGEWFEAWQLAYVTTLAKGGVDLATAEAVVGTSAGSLLGTMLTSGRIAQEANEFAWFAKHPAVMARMVSVNTGAASQTRAREMQATAKSYDPATIQALGRAAMAALNAPVANLQESIQTIIGPLDWPSEVMHTTANDCYTGERVVVSSDSGIPINHAISASMSLPGCFGPTWIDDHYCMDGGISRSGTHADLVAGAKRVLVVALSDGSPKFAQLSGFHAPIEEEIDVVKKSGSQVFVTFANPPKGTNFLDPNEMPTAMEMGVARAKQDLAGLKAFWSG